MKKLLFIIILVTSVLQTTKAVYLIRSTNVVKPEYFKNFTLTFDENGDAVTAGSNS
jgi:hypothetical protein